MNSAMRGVLGGLGGLGQGMAKVGAQQAKYRYENLKDEALREREANLQRQREQSQAKAADVAFSRTGSGLREGGIELTRAELEAREGGREGLQTGEQYALELQEEAADTQRKIKEGDIDWKRALEAKDALTASGRKLSPLGEKEYIAEHINQQIIGEQGGTVDPELKKEVFKAANASIAELKLDEDAWKVEKAMLMKEVGRPVSDAEAESMLFSKAYSGRIKSLKPTGASQRMGGFQTSEEKAQATARQESIVQQAEDAVSNAESREEALRMIAKTDNPVVKQRLQTIADAKFPTGPVSTKQPRGVMDWLESNRDVGVGPMRGGTSTLR